MFSCVSKKQKLNSRSSMEAELVGVDDMMGTILWCQRFSSGQGRDVKPAMVFQDNQGAILLAENGGSSSSSRTRHVDVRYYFVTDCVKKGEVFIKYCPTTDLCSDVLTKPLQGNQFRRLRARLLNFEYDPSSTIMKQDHRSVLEIENSETYIGRKKNMKMGRTGIRETLKVPNTNPTETKGKMGSQDPYLGLG